MAVIQFEVEPFEVERLTSRAIWRRAICCRLLLDRSRRTAIADDLLEWFEPLIELGLALELINATIFNLHAWMKMA
jgi:hypothetical protein